MPWRQDPPPQVNTCSKAAIWKLASDLWLASPETSANTVVTGSVRLSPFETLTVKQRGDAEWVNWCWIRERSGENSKEESWGGKNHEEAGVVRWTGKGGGSDHREREGKTKTQLGSEELSREFGHWGGLQVSPEMILDYQSHVWDVTSDIFMRPAMQLQSWFLVPFRFPCILII